jgi:tripartite ATP-independent transporter DctM subunit
MFMIVTVLWVLKNPKLAPQNPTSTWRERFVSLRGIIPTVILILAVLGSIYAGIVTPTEAASVGAVVALIILIVRRRFSWQIMKKATIATIAVSSMSYMILAGSSLINFLFNYMQVPQSISSLLLDLNVSRFAIYAIVCVMYLILGMFIDGISMVVLTIPTVVPLMTSLGFDPVWLGIILIILVEMALITPPVGVNLFILQGTSKNAEFSQIVAGALPYMLVLVLMLVILAVFPQIALWLPGTMG